MALRITPFRERLRQRRRVILFICTGNTCRSPMAAGYFRKLLDERGIRDVEVRSAGVMTITGLLASQEAIQVMDAEGVDLRRHRSTQLTPEVIRKVDLILAMSPFHRQTALRMSDVAKNKTYLLKEFTRSDLRNVQIADPMGCTLEVFKKCFREVRAACDRLVEHEFVTGRPPRPRGTGRAPGGKAPAGRTTKPPSLKESGKAAAPRPKPKAKSVAKQAPAKAPPKTNSKPAGPPREKAAKPPPRKRVAGKSPARKTTPKGSAAKSATRKSAADSAPRAPAARRASNLAARPGARQRRR